MDKVNAKKEIIELKKRGLNLFIMLVFGILFIIFSINYISAQRVSFCAEKTVDGAWCVNVPEDKVDKNFNWQPTSCESTSYCKMGTCVNSIEGECRPNVPQRVCQADGGVWVEGKPEELDQCQLGCCFVGDQTSFVTQTSCTRLSSQYGVNTTFREDINSFEQCIESSRPSVEGACVIDDGFTRNCRRLTNSECQNLELTADSDTKIEFHPEFLCSAEVPVASICGPSQRTSCLEDKYGVYFLDTCGNVANIYDALKVNNPEYWTKIIDETESCNPGSSNAGSASCGNCDYFAGSICKTYERGNSQTPTRPQYGEFVCADLSCDYNGKRYEHGEEWCGSSEGIEDNLPGSEYHKLSCFNGEVTPTTCDPRRASVCIEGAIETGEGDFSTAVCRANRWEDCIAQDNKRDCENIDKRDCQWLEGGSILKDDEGKPLVVDENDNLVSKSDEEDERPGASCLPLNPSGFDFWNAESDALTACAFANDNRVVKFQKGLLGSWECQENCDALGLRKGGELEDAKLDSPWAKDKNQMCIALGDCGASKNYIGKQGYWTEKELVERAENFKPPES